MAKSDGTTGQDANNDMLIIEEVVTFDRATYNQGENALYDFSVREDGIVDTIVSRGVGGVAIKIKSEASKQEITKE